ncbi:zinc-binding dehydrogenase [uncultured Leuconostoc sp.]|uniref:alcohol dehydrogenase catalytic domain-containing protein n=1 Tax=uncultured Leuconostoc sp. TaxID=173262 RepID=UPI0025E504FC|nr:zinc-binding dehydrogenase [uncultured Leuconostoc sp.]
MTEQMQAIRLTETSSVDDLKPVWYERPQVKPGYVLVKVKAFGINESEITSRKGESSADFSFPRILGIEGVGVIEEVSGDSDFKIGQQIATMMGGMGRSIDGSYAEYMLVNEKNVIPFESDLSWDIIGALPEMLQTAYGSLMQGLQLKRDDVLLIHGGTSTVGVMAAVLAKQVGAKIISTTRNADKLIDLKKMGVTYPMLDDAQLSDNIREIAPEGIDKVLELVGFTSLFKDMKLLKKGGLTCFTGALDGQWRIDNFTPFMIPSGTFLTSYAGNAQDLPAAVFAEVLESIKNKELEAPIAKVYQGLENVKQAQINLESGKFVGKHVVVL